jgi:hypothetical protein
MIGCDFVGLNELLNKSDVRTRDTGYFYVIIYVLLINKNDITSQGNIEITQLISIFKVSDRTNVFRILDRLVKTGLVQYRLPKNNQENIIYLVIDKRCIQYFFQK